MKFKLASIHWGTRRRFSTDGENIFGNTEGLLMRMLQNKQVYCRREEYAVISLGMIRKICGKYFVHCTKLLLNNAIAVLFHILQCVYMPCSSWGGCFTGKLVEGLNQFSFCKCLGNCVASVSSPLCSDDQTSQCRLCKLSALSTSKQKFRIGLNNDVRNLFTLSQAVELPQSNKLKKARKQD